MKLRILSGAVILGAAGAFVAASVRHRRNVLDRRHIRVRRGRRAGVGEGDSRIEERLDGHGHRDLHGARRRGSASTSTSRTRLPGRTACTSTRRATAPIRRPSPPAATSTRAGCRTPGPMTEKRHAGDLGNIEIGANGQGDLDVRTDLLTDQAGAELGRRTRRHLSREGGRPDDAADGQRRAATRLRRVQ